MCLLHNSTIIITSELLGPFEGFICYLFVYAFLYISSVFICLINNNFLVLFLRVLFLRVLVSRRATGFCLQVEPFEMNLFS